MRLYPRFLDATQPSTRSYIHTLKPPYIFFANCVKPWLTSPYERHRRRPSMEAVPEVLLDHVTEGCRPGGLKPRTRRTHNPLTSPALCLVQNPQVAPRPEAIDQAPKRGTVGQCRGIEGRSSRSIARFCWSYWRPCCWAAMGQQQQVPQRSTAGSQHLARWYLNRTEFSGDSVV